MSITKRGRRLLQKFVFGDTFLPQEFFLGLADPQTEITVWLYGMNAPLDVTRHHSMACAAPFTICIAFPDSQNPSEEELTRLSLKFCERNGMKRGLGEIGLRPTSVIREGDLLLAFFEARSSTNFCLPKARLWAHYLYHAYSRLQRADPADVKMSFLERRAAMVMFIRPHPVSLVSLVGETGGNIFPMNLMGDLDNGYFAFALKNSRRAARLVEEARRIALSSVPLSQGSLAYQLAVNHTRDRVEWNQLPFATRESTVFNIPVPVFTQRVREMEVTKVHNIGSHVFFLARIVHDEIFSPGPSLSVIHGFYQAWRLKGHGAELDASRAEDLIYKGSKAESS